MSVAIRELGITDRLMLEELLDVFKPDWSDGLAPGASGPMAFLSQRRAFAFGGYVDDEVAGWLWGLRAVRPTGRSMSYVHELDVVERHRRNGIATSLVEAAVGLARRDGSDRLWLTTGADNHAARALFESTGAVHRDNGGEIVYSWDL